MSNIFDSMVPDPDSQRTESDLVTQADNPDHDADHRVTFGTPSDIKQVIGELLKSGVIDESAKTDLFRRCVTHQTIIDEKLEPLDLSVRLDEHRGVAFVVVADSGKDAVESQDADEWSHPLVRRQRLTLEQSLLIAILRQAFVMHEQEMGVGQTMVKVAVDELLPQFMTYLGDSGSDQKNESRLLNQLDHLKGYGVVSAVDKNQEVTIRPLIAHLANPQSLKALLEVLIAQADAVGGEESSQ
ncbi:DUF4194 domain-containing protein [Rhodopirellula sp. SWK7]|uniref:DUF4194 domain-containing protein n=1 Tax=Rhodopirellula sp. SWK7 TaxID=595460 RepID=UPI0002BFE77B|nr:DUF4194 domain-containing protein [Rhodopirellula sp. SWK7]EMI43804.1 hypothetical protein RRSWK_03654 [Rhodopirellula sp. SWK7]